MVAKLPDLKYLGLCAKILIISSHDNVLSFILRSTAIFALSPHIVIVLPSSSLLTAVIILGLIVVLGLKLCGLLGYQAKTTKK